MTIRLFDVFDYDFTGGVYDGVVDMDDGIIFFEDGSEMQFDSRNYDWEEISS